MNKQTSYIQDNNLIVETKYSDLIFYVDVPSMPTLRFDTGTSGYEISEIVRQLKIISVNSCKLRGYQRDNDATFTINRKEYHNLKVEIDINNSKVSRFYL